MKLRNHPISGDVASSAWLIGMGKNSLPAEIRTLIRGGAFHRDRYLTQGRPSDARPPDIEIIACAKLAVLPLPGLQ